MPKQKIHAHLNKCEQCTWKVWGMSPSKHSEAAKQQLRMNAYYPKNVKDTVFKHKI